MMILSLNEFSQHFLGGLQLGLTVAKVFVPASVHPIPVYNGWKNGSKVDLLEVLSPVHFDSE